MEKNISNNQKGLRKNKTIQKPHPPSARRNYRKDTAWLSIILVLFAGIVAALILGIKLKSKASLSDLINYQAKLTDSSNIPLADGSYNLRFRICTDSASPCVSPIWTETLDYNGGSPDRRVPVLNGFVNVLLGQVSSLSSINFNQTLYLEVSVGGSGIVASWETLSPTKQLSVVPSAFEALSLGGKTVDQLAVLGEDEIITAPWRFNVSSNAPGITVNQSGSSNALAVNGTSLFMTLDTEKVTNGTFEDSSGWTIGTGWSFDAVNLLVNHASGTTTLEQDISAVAGETYYVSFDITNRTAGTVTPSIGVVSGSAVSANGLINQIITATDTGNLIFTPSTDFNGSIDNVSVKKMNQGGDVYVLGKVGIGTTSSSDTLTIASSAPSEKMIDSTNGSYTNLTKTDSDNLATRKNEVLVQPTGGIANALEFDGQNDYLDCGSNSSIPQGVAPFSIAFWWKPEDVSNGWVQVVGKTNVGGWSEGWGIWQSQNSLRFWVGLYYLNYAQFNPIIVDGSWHFVVATFDGTVSKIFYDNIQYGTSTPTPISSISTPLQFGNGAGGNGFLKASLDEVALYDHGLSSGEINNLWSSGSGHKHTGSETGLISLWHLDEVGGLTATDSKGVNMCNLNNFSVPSAWVPGYVGAGPSATTEEATVWESKNSPNSSEKGIQTFGDLAGRTVLQGATIHLNIGSSEKMIVDANGNLGIGTTNPLSNLTIAGISPVEELIDNTNGSYTKLIKVDASNEATRYNSIHFSGGVSENGLSFDGVNDYVDASNSSIPNTGPMTIAFWMKPTSFGAYTVLITRTNDTNWNTGWGIWATSASGGYIRFWNQIYNVNVAFVGPGIIVDGNWHFVVATFDGTTSRLYYDNVEGTDGTPSPTSSTADVQFGNGAGGNNYFNGVFDEVAIYNTALSSTDANNLWNNGNGYRHTGNEPGLVSVWHLDESSGTIAADSKGQNNGTLINFSTPSCWVPGIVPAGGSSLVDALIWSSSDSTDATEKGIQTFGDSGGRSVLQGSTIRFNISNTEKIRIDSNGNFGIGTSTPASALHVIGGVCIEGTDSGCAQSAGNLKVGGIINSVGGFKVNGVAGLSSQAITVGVDGGGTCTITVTGGIVTATTCS